MNSDAFSGDVATTVAGVAAVAALATYLAVKINRGSKATNETKDGENQTPAQTTVTGPAAAGSNDCELAAVFAAAIAAMTGEDASTLQVVSYRKTGQTAPVWNVKGRYDYLAGKL